jgi:multidrug efflux pump subunit AcrA (membrane-fusion protein)
VQQDALAKLRAMHQTAVEQAEHERQLRAERYAAERELHYQRLIGALRESSFRFTMSTPVAALEAEIAALESAALSIDDWAEFLADAEKARDAALSELRTLLDTAKRIAEMDRVAAEQRKRQAELDEAAAALTQREQAMVVPAGAPLVATPEGDRGPSALSGWQGAVERLQSGEPIQPPPGAQLREDLTAFTLAEPERKFSTGAVGAWLGFTLTSGFIEQTLGVPGEPGVGSKAARLWTRAQLGQIRDALIKHLRTLRGPL